MKFFKKAKEGDVVNDTLFVISKNKHGFTFWINMKSKKIRTSFAVLERK